MQAAAAVGGLLHRLNAPQPPPLGADPEKPAQFVGEYLELNRWLAGSRQGVKMTNKQKKNRLKAFMYWTGVQKVEAAGAAPSCGLLCLLYL